MASILESKSLRFRYGSREIFRELSFAVESGEMVALLGANGAGKTTLLNIAAGLLRGEAGTITVGGREVKDWLRRDLSRFVSLVPQHLDIPFMFRVDEIVAQGRVPYLGRFGRLSTHDREEIEKAMEAVDVTGLRDRVFNELSGGERQRVKIAIGLAQQPRLMLLDEPTQHLDIGRQIEVLKLVKKLNQAGITVVAAIHDLSVVRDHFPKSILLMNQTCVAGPTEDVMQPKLLEEAFNVDATALQAYCAPQVEIAVVEEPKTGLQHSRRRRFGRRAY